MPLDALQLAHKDQLARTTALTAIGSSLLVQAGAGSGKTSVLAGRVVMLLAQGRHPSCIAAISFTEFSASELRERIVRFVDALLDDRVPLDLLPAFRSGRPTEEQLGNLRRAQVSLDSLACLTIHGFCRVLLTPYPVEAGIDPGAAMLDQGATDLLFEDEYLAWLRERLSGTLMPDDAFAALYLAEQETADALLKKLAKALLAHRTATVQKCGRVGDELSGLRTRVTNFRAFLAAECAECCPDKVREIVDGLEAQLGAVPPEAALEPQSLLWMVQLRVPKACSTSDGAFNAVTKVCSKKSWVETGKAAGTSKTAAERLQGLAARHYEDCEAAHIALRSAAAGRVMHIVADEARAILDRYSRTKLASAALDFGDLLEKTRIMLARHPEVCRAVGERFSAVLVDEFQDTDPEQMEIIWRICGDAPAGQPDAHWRDWTLRPGALFVVGDPKQSIYRFRGGDLSTYRAARNLMQAADPNSVLEIHRNFRSRKPILDWVNEAFSTPFQVVGQAEFAELLTDAEDAITTPGVAALPLASDGLNANDIRDLEADEVAKFCRRMVGNVQVRGHDGQLRLCQASDIALLAPTGSDLWRYERALEDNGLSVAAQAGKGFFRRQEVQDLIALTRVLADGRDRLALGALLRGPLVGLTDEILLDAVATQLDREGDRPAQLSLGMDLEKIANPLLRSALERLQTLARQRGAVTPHILLCKAVEEMNARAVLRQRGDRVAERALSNLELYLEMARPYDVRGIKAFSDFMRAQWEEAQKSQDGRPDADQHSISLITMHSGKGLEWPVVIPVNTATFVMNKTLVAYDREKNCLHMAAFGCHPVGCEQALDLERQEVKFQNQRLWYVAATRARDLLVMPRLSGKVDGRAWIQVVKFDLDALASFGDDFLQANIQTNDWAENTQDGTGFRQEAAHIAANTPMVKLDTPHLAEAGEEAADGAAILSDEVAASEVLLVRGSRARGLIMHKLLEEVLNDELTDALAALQARSSALADELGLREEVKPDPAELAQAVLRGLERPEIAAVRAKLRPEWGVAASQQRDGVEYVVSGIADAVAVEPDGSASLVVDWKSDVAPAPETVSKYREQLAKYLGATGAPEGLLVFLTPGTVSKVIRTPEA